MDERDEYEIGRVGFYFTRYGVWAHWGLGDLLDMGMGIGAGQCEQRGNPKTVALHQQALRRMLLDLLQPQALDVAVSNERGALWAANYRPSRR